MHLKRLELHGYKSFARKTEFVFDRGITAIIGPNGSGKSNIADAIRWALGETRMTQLRAKVTDDLIFAGSDQRARLGMARVAMTLDNSDGKLPIQYSEVTVERRAYRDGQNEYLINGTKVRLRDVVELLAEGGLTRDTYTVIGQGLVDTMLSLRPQERRGLIDVAAGIRPLQDKRDRALSQLEETRANLVRVRDIIAELAPRLRRLEKQAERARQGAEVAAELADVLQLWYGHQWHLANQAFGEARRRLEITRADAERQREAAATLERRIETWRGQEDEQAETLASLRAAYNDLRAEHESAHRDLAVREERAALLEQRCSELAEELAVSQTHYEERKHDLEASDARLEELRSQSRMLAERLSVLRQEHGQTQRRQSEIAFALDHARQRNFDLASATADLRNRLAALTERREQLARECTTHRQAIADQEAKIAEHRERMVQTQQTMDERAAQASRFQRRQQVYETDLAAARDEIEALREQRDAVRRQLDQLHARQDALAEARRSGADQTVGSMRLLRAGGELPGIIGSVGSLLRVPDELETAIEAVLGPLLNAVVVEGWDHALAAIGWLKEQEAGHATLVVRRHSSPSWAPDAFDLDGPDMLGHASELVAAEPAGEFLLPLLLGRTVVVKSLEAAMELWRPLPTAAQQLTCVTLDGTVVGPAGRVSGGMMQPSILRHERVWRELPGRIAQAEQQQQELEERATDQRRHAAALAEERTRLEQQVHQAQKALHAVRDELAGQQRAIDTLEQEIGWRDAIVSQRETELEAVDHRIEAAASELKTVDERQASQKQRVEALASELETLRAQMDQAEIVEVEKSNAAVQQSHENEQRRHRELEDAARSAAQQIEAKVSQQEALRAQLDSLGPEVVDLRRREQKLDADLARAQSRIQPLEARLRSMRQEVRDLDRQVVTARETLHRVDIAVSEASVEVQRREDRLAALRDKIADDVELAAIGDELPQQLTLALDGEAEALPVVTEIPAGLEQRVRQLRRQLRELASASPEIVAEYEGTKDRYDFLTSQASDLEEAAADLRTVVAELNTVMDERFAVTFDAVAAAFEKYFSQLFGGGNARLALEADEEDTKTDTGQPGLVIVARPPGKRSRSLALLSGGERALTAVALLFALLEISPTPYCVLDEVDAMLDEANIGRFRRTLEDLAEATQFVIITHNRGTVQAASTLYGVSMGADGVSQAISLRLDDLEPVPERIAS